MTKTVLLFLAITALLLCGCAGLNTSDAHSQTGPAVPPVAPPASAPQAAGGQAANAALPPMANGSPSASVPQNEQGPAPNPDLGANADMHGFRPFPDDNAWNRDVSALARDPESDRMLSTIGEHPLHPDFGTVWNGAPIGIPYVVVGANQTKVAVSFDYGDESDKAGYPVPSDAPVEGGVQSDGDRHVLVLDRDNQMLYELYAAYPNADGTWRAGSGAVFNLSSNDLRPARWTSADAAGLPIFPGLVRYDEVVGVGDINHAIRFTVPQTRRAFVCPARHYASSLTGTQYLPMGARLRLKADYDVSSFSAHDQVILRALKKYGMILADNGSPLFITGAPDARWNDEELSGLKRVKTSDFEVVQMPQVTQGDGPVAPC